MRNHPLGGGQKMHHGIDLAVPKGTSLGSTIDGIVMYAGEGKPGSGYGGYGNVVAIRDMAGDVHLFAHMDKVNVRKGQRVGRGTNIGTSGDSGNVKGAHLHYEVRKGGKLRNTVDPTRYLR